MPCTGDAENVENGAQIDVNDGSAETSWVHDDFENSTVNGISSTPVANPEARKKLPGHKSKDRSLPPSISSKCELIPGECPFKVYSDVVVECDVCISKYRIIIVSKNGPGLTVIPNAMLESFDTKEMNIMNLFCKDGRIVRCKTIPSPNNELDLIKRLTHMTSVKRDLKQDLFAYSFRTACQPQNMPNWIRKGAGALPSPDEAYAALREEFISCRFDSKQWRISEGNVNFTYCRTYPQYLIVPREVSDEMIEKMHPGRFFSRFPTAVWRCKKSGGVLLRSAQPTISWLGVANEEDINYLRIVTELSGDENNKQKLLIIDARGYAAALANRTKGGGYESADTYPNTEIEFMALANIHSIRTGFVNLRAAVHGADDYSYYAAVIGSRWFEYMITLFKSTMHCISAVRKGRNVLVHCSDGWDRTPQIVSLCKVMADPYYRTFDGFKYLVQREWIDFGHKFSDRNGVLNEDTNERSPIFLQFLDCVYQLMHQNPHEFEFNQRYLVKLAQHANSGIFGTFLFNCVADAHATAVISFDAENAESDSVDLNAYSLFSIWDYLHNQNRQFVNLCHKPQYNMLRFSPTIQKLKVWRELYGCEDIEQALGNPADCAFSLSPAGPQSSLSQPSSAVPAPAADPVVNISRSQSASSLASAGDLHAANYAPNLAPPAGSPHLSNFPAYIYYCNQDSMTSTNDKDYFDDDGLIKPQIEPDDSMFSLVTQLHQSLTIEKANNLAPGQKKVDKVAQNGSVANGVNNEQENGQNGTTSNHVANGPSLNGTPKASCANGCNSDGSRSDGVETENIRNRSSESISVK